MLFASWLRRFRQSLEEQARVQRALLAGSLHDELRERPARGRRLAHRNPMGQAIEVVEERTLLSTVTFTVNTTNDTVDDNVGNGVAADAAGNTSLRAAIMEANASTADEVEIVLGAGTFDLTIAATGGNGDDSGDLNITNTNPNTTIVIRGAGEASTTIDGKSAGGGINSRIFDIAPNVHRVEIEDVTLQGETTGGGGGGVRVGTNSALELDGVTITLSTSDTGGGALFIDSGAFATVVNSTLNSNAATGMANGGAIANLGTLTLANSEASSNSAGGDGGGLFAGSGSLTVIEASRLDGNGADDGGAIAVDNMATLNMTGSRFTSNIASTSGGGLIAFAGSSVQIESSTFNNNVASASVGGGLVVSGDVFLTNATFSGNRADGGPGGGIRVNTGGTLDVVHSTFASNRATTAAGAIDNGGGTVTVVNSIFANSLNPASMPITDVAGAFVSLGTNIVRDVGAATGFTGPGDMLGVDPLLFALSDNGGGVPTRALQTGASPSPALNAANPNFAPSNDARRVPRGGMPDIGAFEDDPLVYFVNTFDDAPDADSMDGSPDSDLGTPGLQITLRSAIMALNNGEGGNGVIILPAGDIPLTLTSGGGADSQADNDLDVMAFLTDPQIIGAGRLSTAIDASGLKTDGVNPNGDDRVFHITGGNVTIDGVTIENGDAGNSDGGGILLDFGSLDLKNSALEDNRAVNGGGLSSGFSSGDMLSIDNVSFFENTATMAGGGVGLFAFFTATPEITNSNFVENTAGTTGGGLATGGALNVTDTFFIRNASGTEGGGLASDTTMLGGELNLVGSTFRGNMATTFGGGLASVGQAHVIRTLFENNTSTLDGGGIAATSGLITVNSSQLVDNTANRDGGGFALGFDAGAGGGESDTLAEADFAFTTIDGNTAAMNGGGIVNAGGRVYVLTSTLEENTAMTGNGGGLANTIGGTSEVVSSTFSGNMAANGQGGGLHNDGGMLEVTNATVTLNTAGNGGGISSQMNANTTLSNTIAAGNLAPMSGPDVHADTVITSGGHNLIGVGDAGFVNGVNSDQVGSVGNPLNPLLGALTNNGGVTRTHALQGGSPAINAGNLLNLDMDEPEFDVDQTGAFRLVGSDVDIGAFEVQAAPAPIYVTTTTDGGPGSLRDAIDIANANVDANVIVLPAGIYRLDLLGSGEGGNATGDLDVTRPVTILGAGIGATIIDGAKSDRLFDLFGTTVTLKDMTLRNGSVSGDGGAIRADGGTTTLERVEVSDNMATNFGGGVFNGPGASSLIVRFGSFFRNMAAHGGATYSLLDPVTVERSLFQDNVASTGNGGAIVAEDAFAMISGSEFLGNRALMGRGGAIYINDSGSTPHNAEISGSRFADNQAVSGGAVSINDTTNMGVQTMVTVENSEFGSFSTEQRFFMGNVALAGDGGAIENVAANLGVFGSTFFANSTGPSGDGGAISNAGTGAVLLVEDSVIGREFDANSAGADGGGISNNATATVRRTTIVHNFANIGGAIANGSVLTVTNSTISNNMGFGGAGGIDIAPGASATIEHSTITRNNGGMTAGGIGNASSVNLKNSIVYLNSAGMGSSDIGGLGTFTSNGFNLVGDRGAATGIQNGVMNDIVGGENAVATIVTASDATPIVITTSGPHGLADGDLVRIDGVVGNTASNGTFRIGAVTSTTFALFDPFDGSAISSGGGGAGSGGQVFALADAKLDLELRLNTSPSDFPAFGEGPSVVAGPGPQNSQPIILAVPLTHVPLTGSPVIDSGTDVSIESSDNRNLPRNIDIAGVGATGSAPDRGAVEVFYATVTGRKFSDTNGNGMQDGGELGLEGVMVYADVNENGILDQTDPSATTDSNGDYTLTLVPPGAVIISEAPIVVVTEGPPLPGFRQTGPLTVQFGALQDLDFPTDPDGVTTQDFNGDGLLDVAFPSPTDDDVIVLIQQPDMSFVSTPYAVGDEPHNIEFADFDNDGHFDLVVANRLSNNATVLRNQGNGTFVPQATVPVGTNPLDVAVADFNNDGNLDFATVNQGSNNVSIVAGNGMGGFSPLATLGTGAGPVELTAADLDGDNQVDIATADLTGNSITVLTQIGGMVQTTTVMATSPTSITHADLDQDGLIDLIFGSDGAVDQAAVLFNRGSLAALQPELVGAVTDPTAVAVIDLNNDGLLDLIATSDAPSSNVVTFIADPLGGPPIRLVHTAGDGPNGIAFGDLNSDGRPDLFTTNVGSDEVDVQLNLSGSHFVSTSSGAVTPGLDFFNQQLGIISGVKFSDVNSNGTLDVGEPLLPGVQLYLDVNRNGVQDPSDPVTSTLFDDPMTPADETGTYEFFDVVPGDVRVFEVQQPGFRQTTQQGPQFDPAFAPPVSFGQNAIDSLIVDLDNDGLDDVVVLSQDSPNPMLRVFRGTGTQHLVFAGMVQVGNGASSVSAGDIDGDGDLDLAVANTSDDTVELIENEMTQTFTSRLVLSLSGGDQPVDLTLSDLNNDGKADVVIANLSSPNAGDRGLQVFLNNNSTPGAGNYAVTGPTNFDTGGDSTSVHVADLDNDGDGDIAVSVTNAVNNIVLFENDGLGNFSAGGVVATGTNPKAVTSADFDRDGRRDLAVLATSGPNSIQVFFGNGLFSYSAPLDLAPSFAPSDLAVGEFDQDGFEDLVFSNPASSEIVVLPSNGGMFSAAIPFSSLPNITGLSVGNIDGKLNAEQDILVVQDQAVANIDVQLSRFGSIAVNVVSGMNQSGRNFGNVQLGTVSGTKFHDLDLDGVIDPGEDGLPGLTIFLDLDGDGVFTPGLEPSTVTDNDGNWTLTDVPVNVPVSVAEVTVGSGFFQTFPNQLLFGDEMDFDGTDSPQNIALGDIDKDGDQDVAIASMGSNAIHIGLVDPTTGLVQRVDIPVAASPLAVQLADVNGDGNLDVISASNTPSGMVSVALGNGNGTFQTASSFAAGTSPQSLAVADLDGANGLDIAVSNDDNNVTILLDNGAGGFTTSTVALGVRPRDIVAANLDGDGAIDLAVAIVESGSPGVTILGNSGSGSFSIRQSVGLPSSAFGIATGDFFESNAALDLVVSGTFGFRAIENDGSGSATAFGTPVGSTTGLLASRDIAVADLDGDGHQDIAIADAAAGASSVFVGLGDGAGGFLNQFIPAGQLQGGVALGDLTANGRPDVLVSLSGQDAVRLLPNRTGAHELLLMAGQSVTDLNFGNRALPGSISGVKFSDYNGNGIQDGGEPGLGGVTIYVDLDNDDVRDAGEPFAVTAADGSYTISGLETLTEYTVSEEVPAGFEQTAPAFPDFVFSGDVSVGPVTGIVSGDFDGANGEDFAAVLSATNQVAIVLRQANGDFGTPTLVSVGSEPFSIVAADFDGANRIDLAVANEADGTVSVLLNNGSGVFTAQTAVSAGAEPFALAAADLDGANRTDLVVANRSANTFSVLLNNGSGGLGAPAAVATGAPPTSVAVEDFDRDGDLDVAVATEGNNQLRVYLQGPTGVYTGQTPIATGGDPGSVRTADLNGDMIPDLVTINQIDSNATVVLNNSSPGTLNLGAPVNYSTGVAGESLVLADFNDDGAVDIIASGEDTPSVALLVNDGMGAFSPPILFPLDDTFPVEIATINLNTDGDPDLVITDEEFGEVVLVTNVVGSNALFLGPGENRTGEDFGNRDVVAPTVTSILRQNPLDGLTNADQVTFRVTFSEDMQSVDAADFELAGTAGADGTIGTPTPVIGTSVFDITITGLTNSNGTIDLDFASAQNISDLSFNALTNTTPGAEEIYTLDNTAPTLDSFTRQTPSTSPTNADTLVFRATFSEDVSNVDASDFEVTGTTATITSVSSVDASTYDITVSGGDLSSLNGTVGLDVASGQDIVDLAANSLPAGEPATDETYVVDNTAPTLNSFTRQDPPNSPTNEDRLVFRATFSEDVTGVAASDFEVTGTTAIVSGVATVSATTYDITVSFGDLPGLNGTVGLDLAASVTINDLAGNALPNSEPSTDETYLVDNTAPTLDSFTRQTPPTSPTNADTLVFRATFSEDVSNIDVADFAVTGTTATVTNVIGVTGSTFDITVSGGDLAGLNGTVGLDLAGAQNITDLAGNALPSSEPATDETYSVDNTSPTLNSFTRQTPPTSPTNADTLVFRATFSEDVNNVDAADFAVTGTTATITNVNVVNASTFDITVSGGDLAGLNGTVGLDLAGGQNIADLAGNALPSGEPATDETYVVDNQAPTLNSFTRQTPANSPTNADTLVFRATFSEDVLSVDAADFLVRGTTASITNVNAVSASTFDITISGGDLAGLNGAVGLDLAGGQNITDVTGNALPAGEPATDETYLVDNTAPTVTVNIVATTLTDTTPTSSVTFTFSEPTTDFTVSDIVTTNGSVSGFSGSGTSYSATFLADDGIVATGSVGVPAESYTDAAGNSGTPGGDTVAIDRNDAPVIANLNGDTLMFTEDSPASVLDQNPLATVTDSDSADFAGGSLHVFFPSGPISGDLLSIRNQGSSTGEIGFDGATVSFEGTDIGSFSAGSVTVNFNANATPAAVSALLNNITFEAAINAPSVVDRTVQFDLDDGAGSAFSVTSASMTVEIIAVNDAPFFAGARPPAPTMIENGPPVLVNSLADVVDVELDAANNWNGAQLAVSVSGGTSFDVFGLDTSGPVTLMGADVIVDGMVRGTVTQSTGSAMIVFNNNARSIDVDVIARALTYQNTSDNPPATVNVNAIVIDGNTGAQGTGGALAGSDLLTINITAVNDPPVLAGIETVNITYLEADPPTQVTKDLTVSDPDDTMIESATVRITSGFQPLDVLGVSTGESNIMASYNALNGTLSLAGTDSLLAYQDVLRSVTFEHTSNSPLEVTRTVSFEVNDGELNSNLATRNIDVQLRPVTVSGVVWEEEFVDGLRDVEGEDLIDDVVVQLVSQNGTILDSALTMNGAYSLTTQPGTFRVVFTPPDERNFTIQDALDGGEPNDSLDSDVSQLNGSVLLTLGSGESATNVDAGLAVTTIDLSAPSVITEGNDGLATVVTYTLTLRNGPATRPVSVRIAASDVILEPGPQGGGGGGAALILPGGAIAPATQGVDYEDFPGDPEIVEFLPGETTATASLTVNGDQIPELDEVFDVFLFSPQQAVLGIDFVQSTITDDDMVETPEVAFVETPNVMPMVVEGNFLDQRAIELEVVLTTGPASEDVIVTFETVDPGSPVEPDEATPGDDFTAINATTPTTNTVTILAGETSATIQIQVLGDNVDEQDESITVRLLSAETAGGGSVDIGDDTTTALIKDDDDATPRISIADGVNPQDPTETGIDEGDAPANRPQRFRITRTGDTRDAVTGTLAVTLLDGEATADDIQIPTNLTYTIAAGQTFTDFFVRSVGDQTPEDDETFGVQILSATLPDGSDAVIEDGEAIGTLRNDDAAPVISLRQGAQVLEGPAGQVSKLPVRLESSAVATEDIVVLVSTVDQNATGFATAGVDYTSLTNFAVTIRRGTRFAEFTIDILGDGDIENNERIRVRIVSVSGGGTGANMAVASATGSETDVTILTDDRDVVELSLTGGTETLERDGDRRSSVTFTLAIDAAIDRDLTVTVRTLAPSDPAVGGGGLDPELLLALATPGDDFIALDDVEVVIPAGQLSVTFDVVVLGDELLESIRERIFAEIVTFAVAPPPMGSGGSSPAPVVRLSPVAIRDSADIIDDEASAGAATVSIQTTTSVNEAELATEAIVTLSVPVDQPTIVTYATLASGNANAATGGVRGGALVDFEDRPTATVTIPAGQLSATIAVPVFEDARVEGDEVFFIDLLDASGPVTVSESDSQSEVTIVDNDFDEAPVITFAGATAVEGDPGDLGDPNTNNELVFTLTIAGAVNEPVTLVVETSNGAGAGVAEAQATEGDYYQTRRTITLDAMNTTATFNVRLIEDLDEEPLEVVFANIISIDGPAVLAPGQTQAIGFIIDDDGDASFSVEPASEFEGDGNENTLDFVVSVDRAPVNLGGSVSVDVMTIDDSALAGVDYQAVSQTLTFTGTERTMTVSVPIIGNMTEETTKELLLQLNNAIGADVAGAGQAVGQILNDDSTTVVIRVDPTEVSVNESAGEAIVTVRRIGQGAVDVDFATEAGTATAGADYTPVSGTLSFTADGPDVLEVRIPIIDDLEVEEAVNSLSLVLSNARFTSASAVAGVAAAVNAATVNIDDAASAATVEIRDNDERIDGDVEQNDLDRRVLLLAQAIQDIQAGLGTDPNDPDAIALLQEFSVMLLDELFQAGVIGAARGLVMVTDPVDFLLTDTQDRTVGYTASTGEVTENSRAYYSGDANVELVVLPDAGSGQYGLQLSGVDSGEFISVATLVGDGGTAQTITNSGVQIGDTELVLDFTDNNNFPRAGDDVFARLADAAAGDGTTNTTQNALAVSAAAVEALAELQRQQRLEDIRPDSPGALTSLFHQRVAQLGRDVSTAVWNALDNIFADPTESPDSLANAFYTAFGRTLSNSTGGVFELIDLLDLLRDGSVSADSEATDDADDGNDANNNGDAQPNDNADAGAGEAEARRQPRRQTNWLESLVAAAETEKPDLWEAPRPGDRKVIQEKGKAQANRPRFIDIARKMKGDKQAENSDARPAERGETQSDTSASTPPADES